MDKVVELVGGGLLSTGPTPSSFYEFLPSFVRMAVVTVLGALQWSLPPTPTPPIPQAYN